MANLAPMLPSAPKSFGRLSDVFKSAYLAIADKPNPLNLDSRQSYLVVLVDGLGVQNIRNASGHSSFLTSKLGISLFSGFPTTTASSLASLATGLENGRHGFLGYRIFDRELGFGINLLNDLGDRFPPRKYQDQESISEIATASDVRVVGIGPGEYRDSGFTKATMPAAEYVAADSIESRFEKAVQELRAERSLVYLYVPELDQLAHRYGVSSFQWVSKLEDLDSILKDFSKSLPKSAGAVLTADHGVIDVQQSDHVMLDEVSGMEEIQHVGGDPRAPFLYFPEHSKQESILLQLETRLSAIAHVCKVTDLIEAGWLAPLGDAAQLVAPDVILIPKGNKVFYHSKFAKKRSMEMIGQHGAISKAEWEVPLIRL